MCNVGYSEDMHLRLLEQVSHVKWSGLPSPPSDLTAPRPEFAVTVCYHRGVCTVARVPGGARCVLGWLSQTRRHGRLSNLTPPGPTAGAKDKESENHHDHHLAARRGTCGKAC